MRITGNQQFANPTFESLDITLGLMSLDSPFIAFGRIGGVVGERTRLGSVIETRSKHAQSLDERSDLFVSARHPAQLLRIRCHDRISESRLEFRQLIGERSEAFEHRVRLLVR
jgi:hypothetical protein